MEYSVNQISAFADERAERLMDDEYIVDVLHNAAALYHQDKELRDSQAIRTINPNSRLFCATFEE